MFFKNVYFPLRIERKKITYNAFGKECSIRILNWYPWIGFLQCALSKKNNLFFLIICSKVGDYNCLIVRYQMNCSETKFECLLISIN